SLTGLCVTKLDVLDGLEEIKICVGYKLDGETLTTPPALIERFGECEPIYEVVPGWKESTQNVRDYDRLPAAAKNYLDKLESLIGVPVDIVSTGPSRDAVIVRRHPFDA
ncbi:MAG: adenylosuccinate synthetase, partial [Gammaproteobacteria bacterium]